MIFFGCFKMHVFQQILIDFLTSPGFTLICVIVLYLFKALYISICTSATKTISSNSKVILML